MKKMHVRIGSLQNKLGFTLVELLAVIVILAVLALIATPVVLSIIDDAKESAMLRSAEMYLSGVENAVMRENMNSGGNFRPNECTITNGNMTCGSTNVEVEVDGEVPSTGSITFENGKITEVTLNYESGTIVKDSNGSLVYEDSEIKQICTLATDSEVAAGEYGAKYNCKVDPNKPEYTFYLIKNNSDGTSNLIMNANINATGEAVIPGVTEDIGTVKWDDSEYNTTGPIISMTYLYNATKSWTNVEPLNYSYNDREVQNSEWGYQSFISTNGIAIIIAGDGTTTNTIGTSDEPLRARMPIFTFNEENLHLNEITNETSNEFLYNNLDQNFEYEPYGYWLMSSSPDDIELVFFVEFDMIATYGAFPNTVKMYGVRPVITLKL